MRRHISRSDRAPVRPNDYHAGRSRPRPATLATIAFLTMLGRVEPAHAQLDAILGAVKDVGSAVGEVFDAITGGHGTNWLLSAANAMKAIGDSMIMSTQGKAAQFVADTNRLLGEIEFSAKIQEEAAIPDQSTICQIMAAGGDREQTLATLHASHSGALLAASRGVGQYGAAQGPAWNEESFNDLCKLGYFSQRDYGSLVQNCPTDQNAVSSQKAPSSVYGPLQYPVPITAHVRRLQDNFLSFIGATSSPHPEQSEKAWVAAYKYCENRENDFGTPPWGSGRQPNASDVDKIMMFEKNAASRNQNLDVCLGLILERTACPAGSSTDALKAIDGSDDCAAAQLRLCHHLYDDPNTDGTGGLGIKSQHLKDCLDGHGLSDLMADWVIATQDCDINHGVQIGPLQHGKYQSAQDDANKCLREQTEFKNRLRESEALLIQSGLGTAAALSNITVTGNPTSR
jgi:hypothetical protein